MRTKPMVRLRLQLGSQFALLTTIGSPFHTSLCQALEAELTERMESLGVPGVPEVEIVADEAKPMSVRWFVHARECYYPDEAPAAAWSFIRGALLGRHIDREDEQGWRGSMRSATLADVWTAEQLTAFFRLFAKAVLEQRPSVLLGPEQTQAYAARLIEAGFPEDAVDVRAWLAPILSKVLDMGLSIADAERLLPILCKGRAQRRVPPDLVEDLLTELMPQAVEIHASLELIKRFSLGVADGEKLIPLMRDGLFYELGIHYPRFRFVASDALPEGAFAFKIHAWPTMPRVGLAPDELLVNDTVEQLESLKIKGRPAINPANGNQCSVIRAMDNAAAKDAGLTMWNDHGYLILSLSAELRRRSARFVSTRTVEGDLESLGIAFPDLVSRAKEKLGLEQITRVLRNLASEEVAIRNLRAILERVLEFDYVCCDSTRLIVLDDRMPTKRRPEESWLKEPGTLADFVRTGFRRYITHKQTRGESTLLVCLLDPKIEELLERYQVQGTELPAAEGHRVLAAIGEEMSRLLPTAQSPVLLTTIEVRSALRKLIQTRFPRLPVLCYQELSPDSNIQPLARIVL